MNEQMSCGDAVIYCALHGIAFDSIDDVVDIAQRAIAEDGKDAVFLNHGKGWAKKTKEVKCHAADPNNCRFHRTGKFAKMGGEKLFDVNATGAFTADDIRSFILEQSEGHGHPIEPDDLAVKINPETGKVEITLTADYKSEVERSARLGYIENMMHGFHSITGGKYGKDEDTYDKVFKTVGKNKFFTDFPIPISEDSLSENEKSDSQGENDIPDGDDMSAEKAKQPQQPDGGSEGEGDGGDGGQEMPGAFTKDDHAVMDVIADAIKNAGIPYDNPEWGKLDDGTLTLSGANWPNEGNVPTDGMIENALKQVGYANASVDYDGSDDKFTISPGEKGDYAPVQENEEKKPAESATNGEGEGSESAGSDMTIDDDEADILSKVAGYSKMDWFSVAGNGDGTYSAIDNDNGGNEIPLKEAIQDIADGADLESLKTDMSDEEIEKFKGICKKFGVSGFDTEGMEKTQESGEGGKDAGKGDYGYPDKPVSLSHSEQTFVDGLIGMLGMKEWMLEEDGNGGFTAIDTSDGNKKHPLSDVLGQMVDGALSSEFWDGDLTKKEQQMFLDICKKCGMDNVYEKLMSGGGPEGDAGKTGEKTQEEPASGAGSEFAKSSKDAAALVKAAQTYLEDAKTFLADDQEATELCDGISEGLSMLDEEKAKLDAAKQKLASAKTGFAKKHAQKAVDAAQVNLSDMHNEIQWMLSDLATKVGASMQEAVKKADGDVAAAEKEVGAALGTSTKGNQIAHVTQLANNMILGSGGGVEAGSGESVGDLLNDFDHDKSMIGTFSSASKTAKAAESAYNDAVEAYNIAKAGGTPAEIKAAADKVAQTKVDYLDAIKAFKDTAKDIHAKLKAKAEAKGAGLSDEDYQKQKQVMQQSGAKSMETATHQFEIGDDGHMKVTKKSAGGESKATEAQKGNGSGYNHDTATQGEKAQQAIKNLEAKIAAAKDPAMKATYEKVLAKMKAHHGIGDGPTDPDGKGGSGGGNNGPDAGEGKTPPTGVSGGNAKTLDFGAVLNKKIAGQLMKGDAGPLGDASIDDVISVLDDVKKEHPEFFANNLPVIGKDTQIKAAIAEKLAAKKSSAAGGSGGGDAPDVTSTHSFIAGKMHGKDAWKKYSVDDIAKSIAAVQAEHPEYFDIQNGYPTMPYAKKFDKAVKAKLDANSGQPASGGGKSVGLTSAQQDYMDKYGANIISNMTKGGLLDEGAAKKGLLKAISEASDDSLPMFSPSWVQMHAYKYAQAEDPNTKDLTDVQKSMFYGYGNNIIEKMVHSGLSKDAAKAGLLKAIAEIGEKKGHDLINKIVAKASQYAKQNASGGGSGSTDDWQPNGSDIEGMIAHGWKPLKTDIGNLWTKPGEQSHVIPKGASIEEINKAIAEHEKTQGGSGTEEPKLPGDPTDDWKTSKNHLGKLYSIVGSMYDGNKGAYKELEKTLGAHTGKKYDFSKLDSGDLEDLEGKMFAAHQNAHGDGNPQMSPSDYVDDALEILKKYEKAPSHPNAGAVKHLKHSIKKHAGEDGSLVQKFKAAHGSDISDDDAVMALQIAASKHIDGISHGAGNTVKIADEPALLKSAKAVHDSKKAVDALTGDHKTWWDANGKQNVEALSEEIGVDKTHAYHALAKAFGEVPSEELGYNAQKNSVQADKFEDVIDKAKQYAKTLHEGGSLDGAASAAGGAGKVASTSGHSDAAINAVYNNIGAGTYFKGKSEQAVKNAIVKALNANPDAADKSSGAVSLMHMISLIDDIKKNLG